MRARSIARSGIAIVVVFVTACTVAPAASPVPSASPTPNPNQLALASHSPRPTARPTPRPTPTPTASPTPAGTVSPGRSGMPMPPAEAPGTPHVDPDLEASLPALLSGTPLIRMSVHGSVFTSGSDMCLLICGDEPYRYAKELGVGIDDITIAFAISDSLGIGMIAYRARGAKADRLIPARIAIGGYTGHGGLYDLPVTVAGRPVTYLDGGMGDTGEYLMTRHDVLFIVLGEAPSKGTCRPGFCASPPPGPWTVPAHVIDALGGVP
jgi:hypothetical protein